jgi:hypothetical protein
VREQQPTTHQVSITDDGFIWNGGTLVACHYQASLAASPGQSGMAQATLFRTGREGSIKCNDRLCEGWFSEGNHSALTLATGR